MKKIGFIGVGIMGKSMVRNLMKAGFELHIYARTRSKVEDVISDGAIFHETITDCVKDCDAVITIVGFPVDVEEVYFDKGNILDSGNQERLPCTGCTGNRRRYRGKSGNLIHSCWWFQRRLRSMYAVIQSNGNEY